MVGAMIDKDECSRRQRYFRSLGCRIVLGALALLPTFAAADARIEDWVGRYRMNHDGWPGRLMIVATHRVCHQPAWCGLVMRYIDQQGRAHHGEILAIQSANQHMVFDLAFPGNRQRFSGFLFSHDRNHIAGTTVWGGRTFGFFAEREGSAAVPPGPAPASGSRRMLPDGTIETDLGDGTRRRIGPGGEVSLVDAQGRISRAIAVEVQVLAPPEPPPGSDGEKWLTGHADNLLDLIVALVPQEPNARTIYQNNEPAMPIYDKIKRRTRVARQLVQEAR